MQLLHTEFDGETVEVVYSDEPEGIHGQQYLCIRMPMVGEATKSLAWHRLSTLHQAREVIAAEIQRLSHIVDQNV